ncbi:hypothetical protein ACU5CE_08905 [Priestia megaterium]
MQTDTFFSNLKKEITQNMWFTVERKEKKRKENKRYWYNKYSQVLLCILLERRRKTKASVKFICIVDKIKNKYKIVKLKEKLSVLNSEKKKSIENICV